jgi:N-sulfoglucosamine sulfohydrolase
MSHRQSTRILHFAITVGVTFCCLPSTAPAQQQQRPNILWISCEDLSPHFDFYGDKTVKTPNLSRLAGEGVVYDNVFTTAGVCSPSRCAIITGMNQITAGGHNMRTLLNTFPEKTGLPASYSIVTPISVKAFPEYLRASGYYCTNNAKTDYQFDAPATVWDESSAQATWRNRKPGQPFFAVVNLMVTHESQVWARKKHPLHVDPTAVKVPPYYPDTKIVRADMARFMSNIVDLDSLVGTILQQLREDNLMDSTVIFFWSDHGDGLPNYKRELYDRGTHIPLVIRFPDGQNAGTRNDRLISSIDLAPTVLSLAGIRTPSFMQGRAFLGTHQVNEPHQFVYAARDRMDSEYDRVRAVRDKQFRYVRNFRPNLPAYQNVEFRLQQEMMVEMLSLKEKGQLNEVQMRWFAPSKPEEELYDMKSDPYELKNLAADPAYTAQLALMRTEMDRWLAMANDQGATPEKELIKKMWNGGDKPPVTAPVVVTASRNLVTLTCATAGASIGYKIIKQGEAETAWIPYSRPFRIVTGATLKMFAHRIGYEASGETTKQF